MEIYFRPARTDNLDTLLDMMRQFYAIDQYAFDETLAREALKTLIDTPSLGRLWLIESPETAGYLAVTFGYSLEFHGRDASIDELFLTAPYRRQGIGTRALQFAIEQCRRLGIHALHLEVEHTNTAARALYQHIGFEPHQHRYLMTKQISQ